MLSVELAKILQQRIIKFLWEIIQDEENFMDDGYNKGHSKDLVTNRFRLATVSKYWFEQISLLYYCYGSVHQHNSIMCTNINELLDEKKQLHPSVYDKMNEKIGNKWNLLSFNSKLSFVTTLNYVYIDETQPTNIYDQTDPFYHTQLMFQQLNGETYDHVTDGKTMKLYPLLGANEIEERKSFYKQFYSSIFSFSLNTGDSHPFIDPFPLAHYLQEIADCRATNNCRPLESFHITCNYSFIVYSMTRCSELKKAITSLGMTSMHLSLTTCIFNQQSIDLLNEFFEFHCPNLNEITILFNENLKEFSLNWTTQLLRILRPKKKAINPFH